MIRLSFLILVMILYFTFAVYNMEEKIALKYIMGFSTEPLPFPAMILGAMGVGFVLTVFLVLPVWIRLKKEIRSQRRKIRELEKDFKQHQVEGPGPEPGLSPNPTESAQR